MLDLADQREDKALKLASLVAQCIIHAAQPPLINLDEARRLGEAALMIARELGDKAALAKARWGLTLAEIWGGGDIHRALEHGQESLRLARELGLKEQLAFTLTDLVNVYWNLDQMEAARKANLEARQLWLELGNTPMLADSYCRTIWVHLYAGEYEAALAAAREGVRVGHSIGNTWTQVSALVSVAPAYLELGDIAPAIETVEEGIKIADEAGLNFNSAAYFLMVAYLIGRLQRAEMRFRLPEALWLQGRAWNALGDPAQARQALLEAQTVAEKTGARRVLWQILASLAEIEKQRGNLAGAEALRGGAAENIAYIASHIRDKRLRAAFLSLLEVQSVIGNS